MPGVLGGDPLAWQTVPCLVSVPTSPVGTAGRILWDVVQVRPLVRPPAAGQAPGVGSSFRREHRARRFCGPAARDEHNARAAWFLRAAWPRPPWPAPFSGAQPPRDLPRLARRFATRERNGLLLYNGRFNEKHDFIALEVVGEQVQLTFSAGRPRGEPLASPPPGCSRPGSGSGPPCVRVQATEVRCSVIIF